MNSVKKDTAAAAFLEPAADSLPVVAELTEKKSRFLARLYRIESREEAVARLKDEVVAENSAGHHCSAWVAGDPQQPQAIHCSDDGEPSGTAGRPMLAVLTGGGYGNVLVVVSRWFGGVKLGTGGLVRAYSGVTRQVVAAAEFLPFVSQTRLKFSFAYPFEPGVRRVLELYGGRLVGQKYDAQVTLTTELEAAREKELWLRLMETTAGAVRLIQI